MKFVIMCLNCDTMHLIAVCDEQNRIGIKIIMN